MSSVIPRTPDIPLISWSYFGPTGLPFGAKTSSTNVIVGFEIVYCDASATNPSVVLGISKLLGANVEKVAYGENAPTETLSVPFALPNAYDELPWKRGVLQAPPGPYALDGLVLYYSAAGVTQLAGSHRLFAHGAGEATRRTTAFLPANSGQQITTMVELRCPNAGGDFYLQSFEAALTKKNKTSPQLGSITVGCTNFLDFFQMPPEKQLQCCRGEALGECWGRDAQSPICDQIMATRCEPLCSNGVCVDPACGCLGSPLASSGVAQCFDARCADNPAAYRTAQMAKDSCRGENINCAQWSALSNGIYASKSVMAPPGGCTSQPGGVPWMSSNNMLIIIIFVLTLALVISTTQSRRIREVPPLPLE